MSSNAALGPDLAAENTNASNAATALGNFQGTEDQYLSNVNSAIAAGNPFESKDYLTQQNLETSGAMNAENTAANNRVQQTAARTGTNTAAIANTEAENAREGQRQLTQYNAGAHQQGEQEWLGEQQNLLKDQAEGAGQEAGVYGTTVGAENADLGDYTNAADEQQKAEDEMIDAGVGAGGAVGAGFASK